MSETLPDYTLFHAYLREQVIDKFYAARLAVLNELKLETVLRRKNPYLFKAKNIELAGDLAKSIVDAYLSSQEETLFGNLLEGFAIYVSQVCDGGFKSVYKSVDLEFVRGDFYYIVGIKSGVSWGNADQINAMKANFKAAKNQLRAAGITQEIVAVNGCMYGKDVKPFKANSIDPDFAYYKYAGQEFWAFLSGDDDLYKVMITPLDQEAKRKSDDFSRAYIAKVNELTAQFSQEFLDGDGQIDWRKLVEYVSGRKAIE